MFEKHYLERTSIKLKQDTNPQVCSPHTTRASDLVGNRSTHISTALILWKETQKIRPENG